MLQDLTNQTLILNIQINIVKNNTNIVMKHKISNRKQDIQTKNQRIDRLYMMKCDKKKLSNLSIRVRDYKCTRSDKDMIKMQIFEPHSA